MLGDTPTYLLISVCPLGYLCEWRGKCPRTRDRAGHTQHTGVSLYCHAAGYITTDFYLDH